MKPEVWGYICTECAKGCGAQWPGRHVATFHDNKCEVCGRERSVCHMHNWYWPDHIEQPEENEII
jgi:hypothetical protein